ncbi:MAG: carboxypeptidase-like regulatory domain-containing protein, partial [Gemmatimonadota bacterium]
MRDVGAEGAARSAVRRATVWISLSLTLFGCSQPSEPLGGSDTTGEPSLAAQPKFCTPRAGDPDPAILPLICELMTEKRNAAVIEYGHLRRFLDTGYERAAFRKALILVLLVDRNVASDSPEKLELINRVLALVGIDPIDPAVLDGGILAVVNGDVGATLIAENGEFGMFLPAGVWDGERLVISEPLEEDSDPLDTSNPTFPAFALHRTEPDLPFDLQAVVGHCAIFGDDLSPPQEELTAEEIENLRLAKNLDPVEDGPTDGTPLPGGTGDGAEYFKIVTPSFSLPGCGSSSSALARHAGSAGAPTLAGDKGDAGEGLSLAGKSGPIGGAVSSFSPFGIVLLLDEEESATIAGMVFTDNDGIQTLAGASVDLTCDGATEPTATTTSNSDGRYSFSSDTDGFEVGSDCFLEATSRPPRGGGVFYGREPPEGTFTVVGGANYRDIETFFFSDVG